jgi:hypothetical protein
LFAGKISLLKVGKKHLKKHRNFMAAGRIDNRTDRRVDKVAAVLQQIVVVHGDMKGVNLNLLDVTDIHEDNLALFVDQGTA